MDYNKLSEMSKRELIEMVIEIDKSKQATEELIANRDMEITELKNQNEMIAKEYNKQLSAMNGEINFLKSESLTILKKLCQYQDKYIYSLTNNQEK